MSRRTHALDAWFSLEGRIAVVTGGARGLGRAIADGLKSAGATVVVTTRAPLSPADATDLRVVEGCASDSAGLDALAHAVRAAVPHIDILVNNIGMTTVAPLEAYEDADFAEVLHTNVVIPLGLTRRLLPMLCQNASAHEPSRVINIGSVAGLRPQGVDNFAYPASKSALHMLTRHLAVALGQQFVTVNAIAPGPTNAGIAAQSVAVVGLDKVTAGVPLGRLGNSEEVAAAAVYLASPASAFITGAVLPVDGGIAAS